jgi:hypothetical protein
MFTSPGHLDSVRLIFQYIVTCLPTVLQHKGVHFAPSGDAPQGSRPGEKVNDSVSGFAAKFDTSFVDPFVKLCRAETTALFAVSGDTRKIEHIARHTSSGISSFVTIQLSPGGYSNGVRVKFRALPHVPVYQSMVVT